jgi:hypothetical protein
VPARLDDPAVWADPARRFKRAFRLDAARAGA